MRASGTEPVIRVMAEGEDAGETQTVAKEIADVIQKVAHQGLATDS